MQTIVHIGQGKAGSTAIQHAFWNSRNFLADREILYPETLHIKYSHHYFSALHFDELERWPSVVNRMGYSVDRARAAAREEWSNLERQIATHRPSFLVLSTETLFSAYNEAEAARARAHLGSLKTDLRVCAYIRSPISRYLSLVQQNLKSCRDLVQPSASRTVDILRSNSDVFARPVEARIFSRSKLKDGDVVADFIDWTDLPLDALPESSERNSSMSAEAMAVLMQIAPEVRPKDDAAVRENRFLRNALDVADQRLGGATRPHLKPEIADFLNRRNTELTELRDEYGIVFDDVDYDLVGRLEGVRRPKVERISDLCEYDEDRARELLENAEKRLEKKKKKWLTGRLKPASE